LVNLTHYSIIKFLVSHHEIFYRQNVAKLLIVFKVNNVKKEMDSEEDIPEVIHFSLLSFLKQSVLITLSCCVCVCVCVRACVRACISEGVFMNLFVIYVKIRFNFVFGGHPKSEAFNFLESAIIKTKVFEKHDHTKSSVAVHFIYPLLHNQLQQTESTALS